MQSIKSKLFLFILKNRHLLKGEFKKTIIDENFSVEKFREEISNSSKKVNKSLPNNIKIEKILINNIYAEWIIPKNAPTEKIILYIHGGGFISGNCESHRLHVAKFASESGYKALLFNYRLAPENPYPAALEDCVEIYQWLLSQGYLSKNIIIGGESAGATLSLASILYLINNNINLPSAVFSISPNTDLRCNAQSFKTNAKKDIAPLGSWNLWTKMYINNNIVTDPYLSPLFGTFNEFPPLMITIGTNEIHYDDAIALAQKAESANVDVTLDVWRNMVHAFVIMSPLFPEAKQAMSNICEFIKKHLK